MSVMTIHTNDNRAVRYALRCTALLTLILFLPGCGLSPNYARPDLDLPASYTETAAESTLPDGTVMPAPVAAYSAENRGWWRNFSSPALAVLQERALVNSFAFRAEREVLAQALYRARQARADLLPGIDAGGSANRSGRGMPGGYQKTDAFSGTIQASYELDIWGANRETAQAAAHRYIAGLNAWRGAGLSLESEVALTYFAYLAARENLAVYDEILVNAREVLAYQQTREKFGAAAPLDVARQRSSVYGMEAGRISYLVKMTETRNSLCQLIGVAELPPDIAALMEKETLAEMVPPAIMAGIPADLLLRRPDLAQAEANLKASNADIGVARAAFLPGITLSASAGWQSDSLSSLISPASALYSLAASLLQPVFHNGRILNQYRETVAANRELMDRYREAALGAFLEVATALDSNKFLQEQEAHRVLSSEQAAEAYRIARLRYEAGAEDFLAVLNAQETMLYADNQVVQSRLERLNTVVALFKALGGGWGREAAPLEDASGGV
ncbi:putative outer membrane protein [uncultured delta proteobacterium]|uniref:Putative outer membrane protein n=1 Tax=uncultured delta proteobacterium TaxID=34034 RepID=A0A212IXB3_9DELT|nr:putative outer membrane protein [uncultured delta proteobacterium]